MTNMIQNAKDQAAALAMSAYQAAVRDGTLPQAEVKTAPVEIPKDTANGDFTTTFALAASKLLLPIGLMFIGILIIIVVPIFTNVLASL